jgi:multiple sugar transport system ATP-binding protein
VALSAGLAAGARRAQGRAVLLGIRPESIVVRGDGVDTPPRGASWISASVYINEPLGSDQFLTLDVGDTRVKVRASPDLAVRATDRVEVAFEPHKLHLFDGATGTALVSS